MKKETIILLGLGAAAVYFIMKNKKPKAQVIVENAEPISEEEFERGSNVEPQARQNASIIDVVKSVASKGVTAIKQARAKRKAQKQIFLPGIKIPIDLSKARKIARQKARQQKKAQRQTARVRRKRQNVGEISVMF